MTFVCFVKWTKPTLYAVSFGHKEKSFYILPQITESLALTAWKRAFFQ